MGSRLLVVCLGRIYVPLTHFLQDLMIIQQSYGPSKAAERFMNP
jgi:hypothetical protein